MSPPAVSATRKALLDSLDSLVTHVAGRNAPEFLSVDVTMSQAKVLYIVSLRPGIGMSALAAELKIGPSAISGLVDRLVEHAYLERHEDPSDRRQQLVNATPDGRRIIDRIRELSTGHIRPLLDGLSPAELEALRVGVAALERQARAAGQPPPSDTAHSHERIPA